MTRYFWRGIVHQFVDTLRFVGLRDRLRCPKCQAVGTYKPHGGWFDIEDKFLGIRRWICKWCGYYKGMDGKVDFCVVGATSWILSKHTPPGQQLYTPKEVVTQHWRKPVNPWHG